jgi:hypothetical protein
MADRNWFGTKGPQVGTNETLLVKGRRTNTLELGDQTPGFCVFWLHSFSTFFDDSTAVFGD